MKTAFIKSTMIAPCGMNCALCLAYHRTKNRCFGCVQADLPKANHCFTCPIKNCEELAKNNTKFCNECRHYPCRRIKNLDNRYRTKFGMSMIENLDCINKYGIRKFTKLEKEKWTCPGCGNVICVHKNSCMICGMVRIREAKAEA
ncbi:MAG TPA: DUF3795 domain-containing protein [Ignavibacteriaceae bacterium]|nr:DUF3795 domain-containing protein [Ignavibacteriaceae bacterium]